MNRTVRASALALFMFAAACGSDSEEPNPTAEPPQSTDVAGAPTQDAMATPTADRLPIELNAALMQTFASCPEGIYYQYRRGVSRRYAFGSQTSGLELTSEVRAYGLEQTSETDRLNGITRRLTVFVDTGPFRFEQDGGWSEWQPPSDALFQFQLLQRNGQWQADFDTGGAPGHLAPIWQEFTQCQSGPQRSRPLAIPIVVSPDLRELSQRRMRDRR